MVVDWVNMKIEFNAPHLQQLLNTIRTLVPPEINKDIPWAYFDGASQGDPPLGGSGGVLYLSDNHKIQARFSPRHCTNNKAELVALHLVLNLAIDDNITQLQVFGIPKW